MGPLLTLLWDICRLRRGPQDLPYSPQLLGIVCVFHLALQQIIARVLGVAQETLGAGVLSLVFNLGVLYLLLNLRDKRSRFVQTALAIICCAIVFSVLLVPIALMFGPGPQSPAEVTSSHLLLMITALLILAWKLVVDGNILRHSLDVPLIFGIGIAVLWSIAEWALGAAAGGSAAAA